MRNRIVALAKEYGRYGYLRITALLRHEGWRVNHNRVERIWRQEGLKVPQKQPKRARLWFADGSCVRRPLKMLTVMDEYTRECVAIEARRRMRATDVQEVLGELFLARGCPTHMRSDNGPEFIAQLLRRWFAQLDVSPLFIEPGSPWENGYGESFNGKFRYDFLDGELFYTLLEAQVLIKRWRRHYNTKRPHSSRGYRPPSPDTITSQPECA